MKTADEILQEVKSLPGVHNAGTQALEDAVMRDSQFCIMDNECQYQSYRNSCSDSWICDTVEYYTLACVQTRSPGQLGDIAVKIYNEAMEGE
jgi:hypothetical protein